MKARKQDGKIILIHEEDGRSRRIETGGKSEEVGSNGSERG